METKTLRIIQKLAKVGKILSKIIAICCIVGAIGCIAGIVSLAITGQVEYSVNGFTLHGLIENSAQRSIGTLYAVMIVGLIVCNGEVIIAKKAANYFKNELTAGTPFTFAGAKEMLQLGIWIAAVSLATAIAEPIVYAIVSHYFPNVVEMSLGGAAQVGMGIAFILVSLLCKYGAEREENGINYAD